MGFRSTAKPSNTSGSASSKRAARPASRPASRSTWGAGAGRAPHPAPGQGAPPWRRVLPLLIAFALGALVVGGSWIGVALANRPDGIEAIAADLRQQEDARNRAATATLVETATAVRDQVVPVVDALAAVVPADTATGPGPRSTGADDATIKGWEQTLKAAADRFGETPSAATPITMGHQALASSVGELQSAVTAYRLSSDAPDARRTQLQELAATLRSRAIDTWTIGSVQLDEASVKYGQGHLHLSLSGDDSAHVEPEGGDSAR